MLLGDYYLRHGAVQTLRPDSRQHLQRWIPINMISLWQTARTVNVNGIPDQSGRVVLITGGTSGLGFETAKALAGRNATVFMTYRDKDRYAR